MSKEYVFEYSGTKEDFINCLKRYPNHTYSSGMYYYFSDYIVKIIDNEIHFGVERGGHSGGYWYIPQIIELSDRIEFYGTIQYIGPGNNRSLIKKIIDGIGDFLLVILLSPIILLFKLYTLIKWIVGKICNNPKPKEITTEERLFDLMENYLGCVGK